MESSCESETKVLKQRVRDHIDPSRDLGHSDKHGKAKKDKVEDKAEDKVEEKIEENSTQEPTHIEEGVQLKRNPDGTVCEDCN